MLDSKRVKSGLASFLPEYFYLLQQSHFIQSHLFPAQFVHPLHWAQKKNNGKTILHVSHTKEDKFTCTSSYFNNILHYCRTRTVKKCLYPVFNETFVFQVYTTELQELFMLSECVRKYYKWIDQFIYVNL